MAYIGNTVQTQGFAPAVDYFSGNGVTVTFTLSRPVASVAQLTAVIDNVIQNPSTAFTVVGNAITFTSAPLSGTNNIWVEYTSLVTTYAAISQDPSVIGDITATGGYLAEGDFGNSYIDGTIVDYVTGNARITTGPADGLTIYNGGPSARNALLTLNTVGALGVGSSPSYGSVGQVLTSQGSSSAPIWTSLPYTFDYLIVAGGGAGAGPGGVPGGGGAGGMVVGTSISISSSNTLSIVVGAGGSTPGSNGAGGDGTTSSITGTALTSSTTGGGGGGLNVAGANNGRNGGSGGGSGGDGAYSGGSGTSGQGSNGGSSGGGNQGGGGGGGKGAVGTNGGASNGGNGGIGSQWLDGTFYAGGGGAGTVSGSSGTGGTGGGGNFNVAGTANTGGGGGGYKNGGSGVVIIRYVGATRGSGGTITSAGGYTYHTFTTSGTYTA